MKRYLIDGRFLASMSTGVDRYAYQILLKLDKICKDISISILVPPDAKEIPDYTNIRIIKTNKRRAWTQLVFGGYARLHRMVPINLCNEAALIAPRGIVCLHDVCYAETADIYPGAETIKKDEKKWFLKVYSRIKRRAKIIITVSEFSKQRIADVLKINKNRIKVIGNGWQHFESVKTDAKLLNQYPMLKEQNYYFTLTSANSNKNAKWVLEASRYNKDSLFVIAGKDIDKLAELSQYKNVLYTGYASDELAKTLMKYCKAFIFPSYYEGFGIPPLEALSTGARIVVSNTASLPEIFKDTASYIDPYNPKVNIDDLLKKKVNDSRAVLEEYSWDRSAEKLYRILRGGKL